MPVGDPDEAATRGSAVEAGTKRDDLVAKDTRVKGTRSVRLRRSAGGPLRLRRGAAPGIGVVAVGENDDRNDRDHNEATRQGG